MSLTIFRWRSLKTRVTLISLAIFVLGIWTLALYASRMLHQDMQRLLGEQQFSIVSYMAAEINHELDDRLKALEMVSAGIPISILDDAAALRKQLEQSPFLQGLFNAGVIVYREDGSPITSFPVLHDAVSLNMVGLDAVVTALKSGKSSIGHPVMVPALHSPVFGMAVPIRDRQGRIQGVLAGVISLDSPNFLDEFTEAHYGENGYYLLEDPEKRLIITGSGRRRIMQPLPPPGISTLIDRHLEGHDETGVTVNPVGVEVLASAKRIPAAGWFIVAALPTAEAFAPIRSMQQRMLTATVILTLLVGILTWWMLKHQLSPMLSAVKQLGTMSDNKQPLQALPIATQDEIGELIGGFNRLLEALRERETEIELVRQQQFHKEKMAAIGSLAATMAHEVNNPLTAIVGIAEAIDAESRAHQCQLHAFPCQPGLILEQARRAISITRQIGNFAMPQSLHRELLDLNALVRNTASFVTFDSRFHRVKINLDLDPALPAVSCVADHLTQVVMNVLINAGDALQDRYDAPPVIRVSTAMRGTAAVLEIEDNGTGIRPELLNRVFDEYFTTKAPGKGIGLGLSLCRRLIQESGGDISIQSNVGQGTMITVSLPVTSDSIG